jgi:hypothetical protein
VGVQGDRNSIIQNLALVLDITQSQAAVQLTLQFTVRLDFVDGKRVKTQAPAAPAAALVVPAPAPAVAAPAAMAASAAD